MTAKVSEPGEPGVALVSPVTVNQEAEDVPIVQVKVPPPTLETVTTLTFTAGCYSPAAQSVAVSNGGGGTLTWTVGTPIDSSTGTQATWLTVTGDSKATPGSPRTLTFAVNSAHLANSTYTAPVDIKGSDGSTQTVTVTLNVQCVS